MAYTQQNDLRLSAADQVIVNAALMIVLENIEPSKDEAMIHGIIDEVIGRGNPDNPYMARIIRPLRVLRAAPSGDKRLDAQERFDRMNARWDLQRALCAFAKWRLGQALDTHRAKHGAAA